MSRFLFFYLFLISTAVTADDRYDLALVSMASESHVSLFELDKANQTLRRIGECKVDGDPGSQFFDVKRSVLFLGLRNAGKISVLKLDRKSKQLKLLDEMKVDRDPAYLRVDRSGKWLFAAYYATGRVSCFALRQNGTFDRNKDGSFEKGKSSWMSTAPKAHAIVEDKFNRFVFVPHTGPNKIFQFKFDEKIGSLTPNTKPVLGFGDKTGPRHIVQHPTMPGRWFSINEQGSSVTELEMNTEGQLSSQRTVSTIPGDFKASNACADLEITRNGNFLYAANRGHDSLALFFVGQKGVMERKGIFATEKTPRQFSLSPDDKFLISAGQNANKLDLFRLNSENGKLAKVSSVETGKTPWWITLVD